MLSNSSLQTGIGALLCLGALIADLVMRSGLDAKMEEPQPMLFEPSPALASASGTATQVAVHFQLNSKGAANMSQHFGALPQGLSPADSATAGLELVDN